MATIIGLFVVIMSSYLLALVANHLEDVEDQPNPPERVSPSILRRNSEGKAANTAKRVTFAM